MWTRTFSIWNTKQCKLHLPSVSILFIFVHLKSSDLVLTWILRMTFTPFLYNLMSACNWKLDYHWWHYNMIFTLNLSYDCQITRNIWKLWPWSVCSWVLYHWKMQLYMLCVYLYILLFARNYIRLSSALLSSNNQMYGMTSLGSEPPLQVRDVSGGVCVWYCQSSMLILITTTIPPDSAKIWLTSHFSNYWINVRQSQPYVIFYRVKKREVSQEQTNRAFHIIAGNFQKTLPL